MTFEGAAFEELVGSHGGLGGEQTHPFVLFPSDLPVPEGAIHGAESLHLVFRGWLASLGHDRYAADGHEVVHGHRLRLGR